MLKLGNLVRAALFKPPREHIDEETGQSVNLRVVRSGVPTFLVNLWESVEGEQINTRTAVNAGGRIVSMEQLQRERNPYDAIVDIIKDYGSNHQQAYVEKLAAVHKFKFDNDTIKKLCDRMQVVAWWIAIEGDKKTVPDSAKTPEQIYDELNTPTKEGEQKKARLLTADDMHEATNIAFRSLLKERELRGGIPSQLRKNADPHDTFLLLRVYPEFDVRQTEGNKPPGPLPPVREYNDEYFSFDNGDQQYRNHLFDAWEQVFCRTEWR